MPAVLEVAHAHIGPAPGLLRGDRESRAPNLGASVTQRQIPARVSGQNRRAQIFWPKSSAQIFRPNFPPKSLAQVFGPSLWPKSPVQVSAEIRFATDRVRQRSAPSSSTRWPALARGSPIGSPLIAPADDAIRLGGKTGSSRCGDDCSMSAWLRSLGLWTGAAARFAAPQARGLIVRARHLQESYAAERRPLFRELQPARAVVRSGERLRPGGALLGSLLILARIAHEQTRP